MRARAGPAGPGRRRIERACISAGMERAGPEPGPQTIQAAFERQVAHSPNDTAVVEAVDSSYRLSYRELSNAAKQLARKLVCATAYAGQRSEQQPNAGCTDVGAVAAVLVNGSVERMVSYYACLYAGHAFCPLEAGWPSAVCDAALVRQHIYCIQTMRSVHCCIQCSICSDASAISVCHAGSPYTDGSVYASTRHL